MSTPNTLLILFTVGSLLLSSHGMAHATRVVKRPPAQEKVDDKPYESSAVKKTWNFENYTFSFTLPEAMEGYFYPKQYIGRGFDVVFSLGPQKKYEEHRELVIKAEYNDLSYNEDDLKDTHKSSLPWLFSIDNSMPHKQWRTFEETHGGFRFFCAEIRGDNIWYIQAQAFSPQNTVLYGFSLHSPKATWDADYAVFKHALATFNLHEPQGGK